MKTLKFYSTSINDRYLDEVVATLQRGGIVLCPTDTLYALTCDALNQGAIERLCAMKGINPSKQSLSVICDGISQASEYARIDNNAFRQLRDHTPGAYTFVLPAATVLPKAFKGRHTVGVRIPDNPIARAIATRMGRPVLTTSIPSDGLSDEEITMPEDIALRYENSQVDMMADGGVGGTVPSTIVDLTDSSDPVILRQGMAEF